MRDLSQAEKLGNLITADHKVFKQEVNPRTISDTLSWYKISPLNGYNLVRAKTKNSQETEKSLRKFQEPSQKPEVIYTVFSLEFGKSCEELSWNHRTSTPYRSETNGIAERAFRRVREGASAVSLQSRLDDKRWSDSMECYCYLRNVPDLLADGKTSYERRCGQSFKELIVPFGALEYLQIPRKTKR